MSDSLKAAHEAIDELAIFVGAYGAPVLAQAHAALDAAVEEAGARQEKYEEALAAWKADCDQRVAAERERALREAAMLISTMNRRDSLAAIAALLKEKPQAGPEQDEACPVCPLPRSAHSTSLHWKEPQPEPPRSCLCVYHKQRGEAHEPGCDFAQEVEEAPK